MVYLSILPYSLFSLFNFHNPFYIYIHTLISNNIHLYVDMYFLLTYNILGRLLHSSCPSKNVILYFHISYYHHCYHNKLLHSNHINTIKLLYKDHYHPVNYKDQNHGLVGYLLVQVTNYRLQRNK